MTADDAERPLRILIGADTFAPDVNGAARFAERLAAGLVERGHDVHVMAPSASRKHGTWKVKGQPDPYSSGRWYLPWSLKNICRPRRRSPVMEARSIASFLPWIGIDDVPGPRWQEFELGTVLSGLP